MGTRRRVALDAQLGDRGRNAFADRRGHRQRIRVVDVQRLKIRALLADPTQQGMDRFLAAVLARDEAGLLARPEMPNRCRPSGR